MATKTKSATPTRLIEELANYDNDILTDHLSLITFSKRDRRCDASVRREAWRRLHVLGCISFSCSVGKQE